MSYELEIIEKHMESCDNDVWAAVEKAAIELEMSEEELMEIYDNQ